jgi:hypothetical protein
MSTKLLLLSAMVAVCAASPVHLKIGLQLPQDLLGGKDSGNANNYVDMVLNLLNPLLPGELPLPDIGSMFNLHDCYMFGLDNGLHRSGDATMVTVDTTTKFSAAFAMENLGVTCSWKYMLMHGKATGSTALVDISAAFSLELTSGSSPQITEFRVVEMAPIKTDVTGLTILFNWLAEDIANVVINKFHDQIIYVIENDVRALMQFVLDQIVIP